MFSTTMSNIPVILLLSMALVGCTNKSPDFKISLETKASGTDVLLQAISQVDSSIVWVSGHEATFGRSLDGGRSWRFFKHPTADSLQFRDIHAFDSSRILLMSSGPGALSRIFSVKDGIIWRQHFVMPDSLGFLDCMDFWDDKNGLAYGDAIDEYPYILRTENGGRTWERLMNNLPKASGTEGGFAASGQCVTTGPDGQAWIASGAGTEARILYTSDYGNTWKVISTGMISGPAAGHTSVSISGKRGFTTGGDLTQPEGETKNTFVSVDGGLIWEATRSPSIPGALYSCDLWSSENASALFACGPNGITYSTDFGSSWQTLDTASYWALSLNEEGRGYAVGTQGKISIVSVGR